MILVQKIYKRTLIVLLLAALAGCGVQMTPTLVGKQAPPIPEAPTNLPTKVVSMATATGLVEQPTQAGLPPTPPPTPPSAAGGTSGSIITPENAPQFASSPLQAPEFIEYLLWPGADQLLAVSTGSTAYLVQLQPPSIGAGVQWKIPENGGPIAFTPDGSRAAVLYGSGMVGVFEPQPDGTLSPVGDLIMKANNASFSADGKLVLLTSPEKAELTLFNLESGAPVKTLKGFAEGDPIYTAQLSPDGKTAAWRSRGAFQFQDAASGTLSPLIKTQGMITDARFAPDSRSLAAVVGDHLEVYSAVDGKQLTRQQLAQPTRSLAYSPDGKLLAAAYGSTIQLWYTNTWLPLTSLTGHSAPVAKVSFSPDGKTLASADEQGELRIWALP